MELFPALQRGKVQVGRGGFVFEGRFHERSDYFVLKVTVFPELRRIYSRPDRGGVDLRTDGHLMAVVYEPSGFHEKFQEPYLRQGKGKVPFRFNDLHTIELDNRDKLLVSKEPHPTLGMIMVDLPDPGEFVYYFQDAGPETERNVHLMLMSLLHRTFRIKARFLDRLTDHFRENLELYRAQAASYSSGGGFNPGRRPPPRRMF
jgi:hypothetical protein